MYCSNTPDIKPRVGKLFTLFAIEILLGSVVHGADLTSAPANPSKELSSKNTSLNSPITDGRGRRLGENRPKASPVNQLHLTNLSAKTPLTFEPNQGQTDAQVEFLSRGSGYDFFLTSNEAVLVLKAPPAVSANQKEKWKALPHSNNPKTSNTQNEKVLRLKLVDANRQPQIVGLEKLPGRANYFIGSDPKKWRTNIPTFGKVKYQSVYPGIDLVYYGNRGELEHDFIVAPGADPKVIKFAFEGLDKLELTAEGDLTIDVSGGKILLKKPHIYQEKDGVKHEIGGGYVFNPKSESVSFAIAAYDAKKPLVIDPVLSYVLSLGQSDSTSGFGIALDPDGNVYLTGETDSLKFPTTRGAVQTSLGGDSDAYIVKLDRSGLVVYSTYLGGSSGDNAAGIAVDNDGNAYIVGTTFSDETTFPVVVGPDLTFNSTSCTASNCEDAFVAKVTPDGAGLVYCGYIGGFADDVGRSIAVDSAHNAYVTGNTFSDQGSFPVTVGPDLTHHFFGDAFVAKVKADGTGLVYAGYLGGSNFDEANGIAVDSNGNAYVTGMTFSTDFPVTIGPDLTYNGTGNQSEGDAFVAKIKADGTGLEYAGYIGGSGNDTGFAIAVDSAGSAYVTGWTDSDESTFPVTGGPDLTFNNGGRDAFVAKVKSDGTGLEYAGYIGGSDIEGGFGIAVDNLGSAYVTGWTNSTPTFPVLVGPDLTYNGGDFDAFVTKIKADGSGFEYSGYVGGKGSDDAFAIAVDAAGNAYIHGSSQNSPRHRFVAKVSNAHDLAVVKIAAAKTIKSALPATRSVQVEIQNRGNHNETISAANLGNGVTTGLVRLSVNVVDDGVEGCQPAVVNLDTAKNGKVFAKGAITLRPKKTLTINYLVAYNCTNPIIKKQDSTSGDYSHTATVHHDELGAVDDTHSADDVCPRSVTPPFEIDPNPDASIHDKGCGAKKTNGTVGAAVLTNMVR